MKSPSRSLAAASKAVVVVSAAMALWLETNLASRGWPPLLPLTVLAFAIGGGLTRWKRQWGWALVFGTAYLVPVVFQAALGQHADAQLCVWMGALLGALLGDTRSMQWSLPPLWRVPLAFWAMVVALVWPVLALRETDFQWSLINTYHLSNSGLGGPPAVVIVWMLQVALTHMLGILWFDSAYANGTFTDPRAFARIVMAPLAIGAGLGCLLACYQGGVDINFLNGHQWPSLGRAAGSLMDGDAFGALAALWTIMFLAVGLELGSRPVQAACVIASAVAWGGMWATGSRAALATAAIGLIFLGSVGLRAWWRQPRRRLLPVLAVVLVTLGIAAALSRFENKDPITRLLATLPSPSGPAVSKYLVDELWNRNGPFGTITLRIIDSYPLTGIGVGCFNHLFPDLAFQLTGWNRHFFDNAQSWYRHQLAELGLLGSAGCLWWAATFSFVLFRSQGGPGHRSAAVLAKGALCAVGLISMVSMPTQSISVSLTVWVLAAWYLHLSPEARRRTDVPAFSTSAVAWAIAIIAAAGFAVATARVGWRHLRPPQRAVAAVYGYQYGFYSLETTPKTVPFRWMSRHAVDVFDVEAKPWLGITVRSGAPDSSVHPVSAKLWVRGNLIGDLTLADQAPHSWYVQIHPRERQMMVEIRADRVWRPSDFGVVGDSRELSLSVDQWAFVEAPPPGAIVIR